jgi:hypothetical protein
MRRPRAAHAPRSPFTSTHSVPSFGLCSVSFLNGAGSAVSTSEDLLVVGANISSGVVAFDRNATATSDSSRWVAVGASSCDLPSCNCHGLSPTVFCPTRRESSYPFSHMLATRNEAQRVVICVFGGRGVRQWWRALWYAGWGAPPPPPNYNCPLRTPHPPLQVT